MTLTGQNAELGAFSEGIWFSSVHTKRWKPPFTTTLSGLSFKGFSQRYHQLDHISLFNRPILSLGSLGHTPGAA
jgi:hypothetical protein